MGALRRLARHRIGHRRSPRVERVPYGYDRKMSEIIVEVAEPMVKQAKTREQFQLAISLAPLCWNLSLAPEDKRPGMINDVLRKLVNPGESTDDVRHVMAVLIARKEALFPKRQAPDHRSLGLRRTQECQYRGRVLASCRSLSQPLLQADGGQALQSLVPGIHLDPDRFQGCDTEDRLGIVRPEDHGGAEDLAHELDLGGCDAQLHLRAVGQLIRAFL